MPRGAKKQAIKANNTNVSFYPDEREFLERLAERHGWSLSVAVAYCVQESMQTRNIVPFKPVEFERKRR